MATLYTDVAASQNAALTDATKSVRDGAKVSGDLKVATVIHTIAATDADADVIELVRLPAGTRIIPHLCAIDAEAGGTGYSVAIGDAVDPDRYSTAIECATAGRKTFVAGADAALTPYKHTAATVVTAVLSAVNTPTAGNKLVFHIAYVGIS